MTRRLVTSVTLWSHTCEWRNSLQNRRIRKLRPGLTIPVDPLNTCYRRTLFKKSAHSA